MATRTQAREAIIGLLYALDMGNGDIVKLALQMLEEKKIRHNQLNFAMELFNGVCSKLNELDSLLAPLLKEWDISRIGGMERSILRLGAYEILHTGTDAPVVINEAVEFGKIYGGDMQTPKFINGVLDSVLKIKNGTLKIPKKNEAKTTKKLESSINSSVDSKPNNKKINVKQKIIKTNKKNIESTNKKSHIKSIKINKKTKE